MELGGPGRYAAGLPGDRPDGDARLSSAEQFSPDEQFSPAQLLALVQAERDRASAAIEPDARLIYVTWGLAWLVGFAVLYAGATSIGGITVPAAGAGVAFFLLFAAAVAVTGTHLARRVRGVRGVSSRVGAMYGWSWLVGFAVVMAVQAGAVRAGAPAAVNTLLSCALPCLLVGVLYLAGGALWQDRVQYGLGLWILAVTAVGALVGTPGMYLVMSVAGGGGFLLAAGYLAARRGGDRARLR